MARGDRLGEQDYEWGDPVGGLRIGLWASAAAIRVGGEVHLRAAARNTSGRRISPAGGFGLIVEGRGLPVEDWSGPASTTPIVLEPGDFREVAAWRLTTQINQLPGTYRIRATHGWQQEQGARSSEVAIEVRADDPR